MTCLELHCYLENPLRTEIYMYRESLPVAVSEHLAACGECARLFEEQKALGISLKMTRDAAPAFPGELDARVLANYRRQMVKLGSSELRRAWNFPDKWLGWGAAPAAAAAVIAIVVFMSRGPAPITARNAAPAEQQVPAVQQSPAVSKKVRLPVESPRQETPEKRTGKTVARASANPLPAGFANLMYCDELTCAGTMEVIRVELPPPGGSTGNPAASRVMAEVLVGADGIARGIRIVR